MDDNDIPTKTDWEKIWNYNKQEARAQRECES